MDYTSFDGPSLNPDFEQIIVIDLANGISLQKGNTNLQDTLISIENATFIGDVDVEITGNDSANVIRSYEGDDLIYGGDGNDVLSSGSGNDFIYGENGDDVLVLTSSGTQHFDGGEGTDRFRNVFA